MGESITEKILAYSTGRGLSKLSFVLAAIAISTFAMGGFILKNLNFELGLQIRDYIALLLIIPILLIKNELLVPPQIPFIADRFIKKLLYISALIIIAIGISTMSFDLINKILDITILDFDLLAIRNIIAVILLFSAKSIHDNR